MILFDDYFIRRKTRKKGKEVIEQSAAECWRY